MRIDLFVRGKLKETKFMAARYERVTQRKANEGTNKLGYLLRIFEGLP